MRTDPNSDDKTNTNEQEHMDTLHQTPPNRRNIDSKSNSETKEEGK